MSDYQLLAVIGAVLVAMYFQESNSVLKKKSNFKMPRYNNKKNESNSNLSISPLVSTNSISPKDIEEKETRKIINNESSLPSTLSYNRSYGELINLGCKPTFDGSKQVIRVSKSLDGRWFYCRKSGFNSQKDRIYLALNKMPYLQTLLLNIELNDPLLKIQGGRVLIAFDGHYRKNIYSYQLDSILVN